MFRFFFPLIFATFLACDAVALRTRSPVRSLLVDNYDSYTYNLWQLLSEINGVEPIVVYNNAYSSWEELRASLPEEFDNVVLSPGPGHPSNPSDFGLCMDAIRNSDIPLLGVCLGHQGIASFHGAHVDKAPEPVHGRLSPIRHSGKGIFRNVAQDTKVVRYHSLIAYGVEDQCPELEETAWTSDGDGRGKRILMGLQHKSRPIYGVQFHPESIATSCGSQLLSNFRDITLEWMEAKRPKGERLAMPSTHRHASTISTTQSPTVATSPTSNTHNVYVASVPLPSLHFAEASSCAELLFCQLYGTSSASFWLDSALPNNQSAISMTDAPTLSFLGSLDSPGDFSVEYLGDNQLVKRVVSGDVSFFDNKNIFEFLQAHVDEAKEAKVSVVMDPEDEQVMLPLQQLPFDVTGSIFGYLGYEARHEAAHIQQHSSVLNSTRDGTFLGCQYSAKISHPNSLFLSPSRYLVVDHDNHRVYCVSTSQFSEDEARIRGQDLKRGVVEVLTRGSKEHHAHHAHQAEIQGEQENRNIATGPSSLVGGPGWNSYRQSIEKCLDYIAQGETYEVCLTTQFAGEVAKGKNALQMYRTLRAQNPAPYACFLHYDPCKHFCIEESLAPSLGLGWYRQGGLSLCSSSPERFVKSTADGVIESKPIKGTMRRSADPEEDAVIRKKLEDDEKSQAENLMIVDLVRNDLGRVATVGSVQVPGLMKVETYKTVHHMVSTIRAKLRPHLSIVDALVATFPGGSMTGAPKVRTMEIIEEIEKRGRGVYSGAIGYIAKSGAADLNIAIRTAVISGDDITVSCGGAIIALSDPDMEMDEAILKAQAVSKAIGYQLCSGNTERAEREECYTDTSLDKVLSQHSSAKARL